MLPDNVEIVRRAYAQFNDEAFDRMGEVELRDFDPDVEVDLSSAALDGAVYRGHDGLREWFSLLRGMWKRQWFEPQEFIPVDEDLVVVPMRIVSLGRYEIETVAHAASVWTLREGKVTRVKAFQSKADALAAVGPRE